MNRPAAALLFVIALLVASFLGARWRPRAVQELPLELVSALESASSWQVHRAATELEVGLPVGPESLGFHASGEARYVGRSHRVALLEEILEGVRARRHEDPYLVAALGPEFLLLAQGPGGAVALVFSFGVLERVEYAAPDVELHGFVNTADTARASLLRLFEPGVKAHGATGQR